MWNLRTGWFWCGILLDHMFRDHFWVLILGSLQIPGSQSRSFPDNEWAASLRTLYSKNNEFHRCVWTFFMSMLGNGWLVWKFIGESKSHGHSSNDWTHMVSLLSLSLSLSSNVMNWWPLFNIRPLHICGINHVWLWSIILLIHHLFNLLIFI